MVWRPAFEDLQKAILAENTFPIWYVEAWATRGICPPPLLGQPESASSAFFMLAGQDGWDWQLPLHASDEQG
jgi:hypothetical protein